MKKTLAAVAILGAFAGSALADVTLYGIIDEGVVFTHTKNVQGQKADTWGLESGIGATSRLGLKGEEKISDDLTVGFKLEKKFSPDSSVESKDFDRGSYMYVKGAFGQVTAGYHGLLNSGTGPHAYLGGSTTGISGGWADVGNIGNSFLGRAGRTANNVTYVSPKMAGVQVVAQATLGAEDKNESTHKTDRVYNAAVTYGVGALNTGIVMTFNDEGHSTAAEVKDGKVVSAFATYDFDVAKVYVAGQYFKDLNKELVKAETWTNATWNGTKDYEGYGMSIAASAPIMGGELTTGFHFGEAEQAKVSDNKRETFGFAAFYEYPLSKMTSVYGLAGYEQAEYKTVSTKDKTETMQAAIGMTHKF